MKVKYKLDMKKDLYFFIFSQLNSLGKWDLKPSDIKILSELYNTNFQMASTGAVKNYEDRMSILFSTDTKHQIMTKLNMSYNTFNNGLTKLRKKGLITPENTIQEKSMLIDLNKDRVEFIIEFNNEC